MDPLICLDIDGTITDDKYSVPKEICDYLKDLSKKGLTIFFETGRDSSFALRALSEMNFPYYLACQNGSVVLSMPEKKILTKTYMKRDILPFLEEAYKELNLDYLIYAGCEKGDFCYYRRDKFSDEYLQYLDDLQQRQEALWENVKSFDGIEAFPLIKGFGPLKVMEIVKEDLSKHLSLRVSLNKDPFKKNFRLLLITDSQASKGNALLFLKEKLKKNHVIAAGDDNNDKTMIEQADYKIVINTAPERLKEKADKIALPPSENGIIHALKEVL